MMIETIEQALQPKRRGRPPKIMISAEEVMKESESQKPFVPLQYGPSEQVFIWASRLEQANTLRAGLMDSESRHQEIAALRHALIEAVIAEMRA